MRYVVLFAELMRKMSHVCTIIMVVCAPVLCRTKRGVTNWFQQPHPYNGFVGVDKLVKSPGFQPGAEWPCGFEPRHQLQSALCFLSVFARHASRKNATCCHLREVMVECDVVMTRGYAQAPLMWGTMFSPCSPAFTTDHFNLTRFGYVYFRMGAFYLGYSDKSVS